MVRLEGPWLASISKHLSASTKTHYRPSSSSPTNIWPHWSTSGPVAHPRGGGERKSMPQQISHFLQGTVAPLMATMCFVLAADTLGVQLTAMCTPLLSPCNFLGITGEAFTTQGSNAHAGTSFERCGQVQEKFKGGRALFSLISLAVITKVPHQHCGWAQLAAPEARFQVYGTFFRELSVPDAVGTPLV